jgi:hypothetical protein
MYASTYSLMAIKDSYLNTFSIKLASAIQDLKLALMVVDLWCDVLSRKKGWEAALSDTNRAHAWGLLLSAGKGL